MSLEGSASEILERCVDREAAMLSLIDALVSASIEGSARDGQGVCREMLAAGLSAMGFEVTYPELPAGAPHLLGTRHGADGAPTILLLGHLDAPPRRDDEGHVFQRIDARIYGPGVAEMKTGLVMMLTSLEALLGLGHLDAFSVRVLVVSDFFSPEQPSTHMIRQLGRHADAVFCFHPTIQNDAVIGSRSGLMTCRFDAVGRGAALDEADRVDARSAIVELAHQIPAIAEVSDPQRGVRVNCGVIQGGTADTVVAEHASLGVVVSCQGSADHLWVQDRFQTIAHEASRGVVDLTLHIGPQAAPWAPSADTDRLVDAWRFSAEQMGIDELAVVHGHLASLANVVHLERVPVIDGLGPVSGALQTAGEWSAVSDLSLRVAMNTLAMLAWLEDHQGEASWRQSSVEEVASPAAASEPKSREAQLEEGIGIAEVSTHSEGDAPEAVEIDLSPDDGEAVFVSTYVGDLEDDDELLVELAPRREDEESEG